MKILKVFLILIIFSLPINALAGVSDNVTGYAWSENIGWIDFNCTNLSSCVTSDYGVNVDPVTGNMSGYAWSENIGWIRFDPPSDFDTGLYPGGPQYSARLNLDNGFIYGWIRACAGINDDGDGIPDNCNGPTRVDGWDGWIKMRCDGLECINSTYTVLVDQSTGEFQYWAWGSDVVGWINFNCLNQDSCVTSDYKVVVDPDIFNQPPSAINLSEAQDNYCGASTPPVRLSWEFSDPNPSDTQSAYQVQVDNNSNFSSPEVDSGKISSSSTTYAPGTLSYNTTYYWRVKVWDQDDNVSDWANGTSLTTAIHHYPFPDFTHSPQSPSAEEEVEFTDTSTCYDGTNNPYNCKDNVANRYQWDFKDDGIGGDDCDSNLDSSCRGDVVYTYSVAGDYTVKLYITDDLGTCDDTGDSPIGTTLPLPEWKEIPPFSFFNNLLASIISFFEI